MKKETIIFKRFKRLARVPAPQGIFLEKSYPLTQFSASAISTNDSKYPLSPNNRFGRLPRVSWQKYHNQYVSFAPMFSAGDVLNLASQTATTLTPPPPKFLFLLIYLSYPPVVCCVSRS